MENELALASFMLLATLSPGPNNFIVMRASAAGGKRAALVCVLGVLLGSILLLFTAQFGLGLVLKRLPAAQLLLTWLGSGMLVWMGLGMIWNGGQKKDGAAPALASSTIGVALFQLLNPKSWLMAVTILSISGGLSWHLVLLFLAVMLVSLSLWTIAGALLMAALRKQGPRIWFDRAMGLSLIGCAALLLG